MLSSSSLSTGIAANDRSSSVSVIEPSSFSRARLALAATRGEVLLGAGAPSAGGEVQLVRFLAGGVFSDGDVRFLAGGVFGDGEVRFAALGGVVRLAGGVVRLAARGGVLVSSSLSLLLLLSPPVASFLLRFDGGCRHLRLLVASFLFRFIRPVLRALWCRVVLVGKAALSDIVPYLVMLERRTFFDHVDSSHLIGLAFLFWKTYATLVFRYSSPRSNESFRLLVESSSGSIPGQASIISKIGLQCRLKSLSICFGNILLLKARNGRMGAARAVPSSTFLIW
jgi:hypothetical protein